MIYDFSFEDIMNYNKEIQKEDNKKLKKIKIIKIAMMKQILLIENSEIQNNLINLLNKIKHQ